MTFVVQKKIELPLDLEFLLNGTDAGEYYPSEEHSPLINKCIARPLKEINRITRSPKSRKAKPVQDFCVFCRNNEEPEETYKSHSCKDAMGNVTCPRLRAYVCPICSKTGKKAHTTKYCPQRPVFTLEMTEKMGMQHRRFLL